MITCPKCGSDNMIGAIFCRTCGEKLNLDELKPDAFDEPDESMGHKIGRIAQRILILALVVGGIGVLVGLFWPLDIQVTGELDPTASARAERKFGAVQQPSPKLPAVVPFSSAEATSVVNKQLGMPKTKGAKRPTMISVEFLDGGRCRLTLKSVLFGQVPMYTVALTKPVVEQAGDITFQILDVKAGKLPLPGGLRKVGLDQFKALGAGSVMGGAKGNVKAVTVGSDSCEVRVR